MRGLIIAVLLFLSATSVYAADEGWKSLFDGKTINGWENPYEWGKATVADGVVQLTSTKGKWFLCTKKEYADFVFEAEVKIPAEHANSGFMFRAHKKKNKVFGYQAEVDPSDRAWSGGLYDEGRRGWLHPKKPNSSPSGKAFTDGPGKAFKRGEWNKYKIHCVGSSLKIYVNETLCTDYVDEEDSKGYIALQHHGEKGKIYSFRNIRIKELNGWKSLFDGKTMAGWQLGNGKTPTKGWVVKDGCIYHEGGVGSIYSAKIYENFELEIEWKIAPGGNSGIKYRFKNGLGPEFQVLDDTKHGDGRNSYTSAASMYFMAKPNDNKKLKPVGEFNKAKIVARGPHLEHWLNGRKVLEMEVESDAWNKRKAKTKFKNAKGYGVGPGKIQLQEHGAAVWYRNIRIRKL